MSMGHAGMEQLKNLRQVLGMLLQLIALAVVIYQLNKVNTPIRVLAQAAPYQQASATRSLLVECPHLRKYLFHDKPIERDAEEYDRARTIAEMLINYPEHLVIQQGSIRAHDLEAWQHFVSDMFTHSPLMRQVIEDNRGSYSRDLMRLYETRVH